MKNEKYLIVVGGPTASGKTAVAIELAKHFNTEIISADSRQFYRQMTIGTAKPSPAERKSVPHHLIDQLNVDEPYSVGHFERDAIGLLNKLYEKHDIVILAGGSGLFIRAICEGLDTFPPVPGNIRKAVEETYREKGIAALQDELHACDPVYYSEVDLQNPQRLIRALSICRASGRPFSSYRTQKKTMRAFHPIYILLEWDREALYERINTRVDRMIEAGLLEEVKNLYPLRHLNALQTVGYQELFAFIDGELSKEEAIDKIKQNSRRYVKRQMTWFRKRDHWQRFHPDELERMIEFIEASLHAESRSEH